MPVKRYPFLPCIVRTSKIIQRLLLVIIPVLSTENRLPFVLSQIYFYSVLWHKHTFRQQALDDISNSSHILQNGQVTSNKMVHTCLKMDISEVTHNDIKSYRNPLSSF